MASTAEPARQLYWTKRSSEEMDRLDLQHYLLLIASGGLLHPPSVDLSSARRILDCATGTTVWARHVLAGGGGDATNQQITLRPDCIFDICDLSDSQLPDPLPKGIHEFFKYDIIKPFPEERRGTYDLIHQRFLVSAVGGKRWPQVISNLKDGLAPGGFLVLHETSPLIESPAGPEVVKKYHQLIDVLKEAGLSGTLPQDLEGLVRDAGFVDVQAINYSWPFGPAGAHFGSQYASDSFDNIDSIIRPPGALGMTILKRLDTHPAPGNPTQEEASATLHRVMDDVKRVGGAWQNVIVVGRKPL